MSKLKPYIPVAGSLLVGAAFIWAWRLRTAPDLQATLIFMTVAGLLALPLYFAHRLTLARPLALFIWGVAVVLRLSAWSTEPLLSDDVYRYVWDGKVQLAGINPYRYAPSDPRLPLDRNGDFGEINHKEIPTIYPPLAQMLFWLLTWLGPGVWTFKAAFALLDLATGWLLWQRLRNRSPGGGSRGFPGALLLYLWHPLLVLEYAGSGHVDSLWIFLFILSWVALTSGRSTWAACALAGAISAKYIALAFVPLFWCHAGTRRTLLALGLALLSFGPYLSAGPKLVAGLQAYALFWQFNGFIFGIVASLPEGPLVARLLIPFVAALGAVAIARKVRDLWLGALATTVLLIALVPVNYPWYWGILVALLVVRPQWPLYAFSLALLLTYEVLPRYYATDVWHLSLWVRLVEGTLLLFGLWQLWRRWQKDDLAETETPAGFVGNP